MKRRAAGPVGNEELRLAARRELEEQRRARARARLVPVLAASGVAVLVGPQQQGRRVAHLVRAEVEVRGAGGGRVGVLRWCEVVAELRVRVRVRAEVEVGRSSAFLEAASASALVSSAKSNSPQPAGSPASAFKPASSSTALT